jgi:hypothetical protein
MCAPFSAEILDFCERCISLQKPKISAERSTSL